MRAVQIASLCPLRRSLSRPGSRHDSLADDRVQGQHAAAMPHRRIEIGLGHLVVSAPRVEEDKLGDLPFLESLSRSR